MGIVNRQEISLTPLVAVAIISSNKIIMKKTSLLMDLKAINLGQLKRNKREDFLLMALIIELSSSSFHTLES